MSVMQIIGLVIKWGPSLVSLAWKIYKLIEDYADQKKNDAASAVYDGQKATSQDKQQRFDMLMKVKARETLGRDLTEAELEEIREGVHKAKRKKRGKAK